MRVVFFGTPEFAVPSLTALINAGVDVAAVVTQPDRARGRSHSTLLPSPVKSAAIAAGIPVLQPEQPRGEEFERELRALSPDLGVVVAYGHLLRPAILAIPRLGLVNVHASLLPRWRGAAPIQWAMLSGDGETGVAIMRLERGLDTGGVWLQRTTPITDSDTTATLTTRLAQLGAQAIIEALPTIADGVEPVPQDDAAATHAPKIDRDVARIRWNESADAVARRIRAMDPAPGAWTTIGGINVKLFGARPLAAGSWLLADVPGTSNAATLEEQPPTSSQQPPGTIVASGGVVAITTGTGAIEIAEVQPAGKRRMPAAEWLRGASLPDDARFE